jgi:hypothetical protein
MSDTSERSRPERSSGMEMSGLPVKTQIFGSRTAQPKGVGTMHQPPTQTLGMSIPRLTAKVSQTTSSSPMRTVLSPRRSTLPFSRWNATAYDAVNGPKLPLSEADSLKESRSCSKSAVNAGSEAAMVMSLMARPPRPRRA